MYHSFRTSKLIISLLLVVLMLLSLYSCKEEELREFNGQISSSDIPSKDSTLMETDVDLYYLSSTGNDFACETRTVSFNGSEVFVDSCMQQNFLMPHSNLLMSPIPSGVTYDRLTLSYLHCDMYVDCDDANAVDINSWLQIEGMLLHTINGLFETQTLSLYVNDKAIIHDGMPIGYGTYNVQDNADAYVNDRHLAISAMDNSTTRNGAALPIQLYTNNSNNGCLYAQQYTLYSEAAGVDIDNPEYLTRFANDVLSDLSSISSSFLMLTSTPITTGLTSVRSAENGNIVIFSISNKQYSQTTKETIAKAFTLAFTGILPDTYMTRISFDGGRTHIENTRYSCMDKIGTYIKACFSNISDPMLSITAVPIAYAVIFDINNMTAMLFDESQTRGTIFPKVINSSYLIDAYVSDKTAVLNMKPEFYEVVSQYLTDMDSTIDEYDHERLLIYSVVNTYTFLHCVDCVLFLSDGEPATSVGQIRLDTKLYPNPGLTP